MGDGIERHGWIGNDARTIVARDLAMQFGAICFNVASSKATALDALGRCTNLRLRLQGNALRFQTAMIDAGVDVEFGQAFIGQLRPSLAPALDQLGSIPVSNLCTKTVLVHGPHGEHDMSMRLGTAILRPVPVHIEIGDHALADKLGLNKVARQFDALRLAEFTRQRKLDLAGKLRILADLERLDIVPQPFAVAPGLRCILRQHHLGMDDTALGREVMAAFDPLVTQPRGRAVGGRRHSTAPSLAANDLDVKMIDRHRDQDHLHVKAHVGTTYKRALPRKILGMDQPVPGCLGNPEAFRQALAYHPEIDNQWRQPCANHGTSTPN